MGHRTEGGHATRTWDMSIGHGQGHRTQDQAMGHGTNVMDHWAQARGQWPMTWVLCLGPLSYGPVPCLGPVLCPVACRMSIWASNEWGGTRFLRRCNSCAWAFTHGKQRTAIATRTHRCARCKRKGVLQERAPRKTPQPHFNVNIEELMPES